MNAKKRFLILTADAGFGHRSAAEAIEAAFQLQYPDAVVVDVINPLNDKRTPALLRDSQSDYDKLIKKAPELYRLGYEASDTAMPSALLESAITVMLFEVLRDILKKYKPDGVISTYPLYQAPLTSLFALYKIKIPLIEVVTDLATVHRIWFQPAVDILAVPTSRVQNLALDAGVPAEKIHLTGIPVHPAISEDTRSQQDIRKELGWETHLRTILAVGSKRVQGLPEVLNVINHFGAPLQLAVVCGKDEEMYSELKSITWHIPVHIYDFVTNMPELMRAADMMVCKAGGLIVTESLASGLPMLLVDVIPGQETGNMEFVVDNGAGAWVTNEKEVLETLCHLLMQDGKLMAEWSTAARQVGRPRAAFEVATLAYEALSQKLVERKGLLTSNLIALLTSNHIKYTENENLDSVE